MNAVEENLQSSSNAVARDLSVIISSPVLREFLALCLFETAYYFAYRYGMSFSHECASPFWFPDSVLLCALLLSRPARWWIFILALLPIRLFVAASPDVPQWFLLATFAIDSAKGLLTATILRRFIKNPMRLETVQEFGVFCLFAVLLIPLASAFSGAAIRHSLGYAYWSAWEQWFMGDALAQLIVTPAIFYLVLGSPWNMPLPSAKRLVEGGLLTAGLILTGFMAFSPGFGGTGFAEPRFYAPVPFLFWAAIRFGMLGASGAITIIAFLSVEAALKGGGPFSGQSPADTALALQQFLLLRAAPLYLVAVLIEQKKGDERSLRELRQELTHVGRVTMLGQLSSSLAHELNQPLGAILRNAEAAEIFLQSDHPDLDELRAIVADIRKDDQRAGEVIARLRALLKRSELDLRSLSLSDLVEEVVMLTRTDSATRHVAIETDMPNEWPFVNGDRVHLQQVLLNLLINGMDALAEGADGSRTMTVRAQRDRDGFVEVAVSDNGPGIPAENLGRLFEPFFTTKPQGMGLGLPISETIIKAHGGRLWAENNAAGGATFRFTLPPSEGVSAS